MSWVDKLKIVLINERQTEKVIVSRSNANLSHGRTHNGGHTLCDANVNGYTMNTVRVCVLVYCQLLLLQSDMDDILMNK